MIVTDELVLNNELPISVQRKFRNEVEHPNSDEQPIIMATSPVKMIITVSPTFSNNYISPYFKIYIFKSDIKMVRVNMTKPKADKKISNIEKEELDTLMHLPMVWDNIIKYTIGNFNCMDDKDPDWYMWSESDFSDILKHIPNYKLL